MQQGLFVADVCYYYGDHVPNFAQLKRSDPAHILPGYDYDVITEEALLTRLSVKHGRLVSARRHELPGAGAAGADDHFPACPAQAQATCRGRRHRHRPEAHPGERAEGFPALRCRGGEAGGRALGRTA